MCVCINIYMCVHTINKHDHHLGRLTITSKHKHVQCICLNIKIIIIIIWITFFWCLGQRDVSNSVFKRPLDGRKYGEEGGAKSRTITSAATKQRGAHMTHSLYCQPHTCLTWAATIHTHTRFICCSQSHRLQSTDILLFDHRKNNNNTSFKLYPSIPLILMRVKLGRKKKDIASGKGQCNSMAFWENSPFPISGRFSLVKNPLYALIVVGRGNKSDGVHIERPLSPYRVHRSQNVPLDGHNV